MAYRSIPGKIPAELLFKRTMKTKMPELTYMEEEVEEVTKRSGTETPKGNRQTRIMLKEEMLNQS